MAANYYYGIKKHERTGNLARMSRGNKEVDVCGMVTRHARSL